VSWNLPSWTISVEFFAYLLFPLVALCLNRWRMIALVAAGAYVLYGSGIYRTELLAWGADPRTLQFAFGNYLAQYFAMFLLGMLTFRLVANVSMRRWEADAIAAAGLAWLISCSLSGQVWKVPYASALLILGLASDKGVGRLVFGNPVAVFLGNVSYALYLSHVMVITSWFWWTTTGPTRLLPVLIVALAVATVLHYAFERPARGWLRELPWSWGGPSPRAKSGAGNVDTGSPSENAANEPWRIPLSANGSTGY
jgi:peptidoglycan/LPS O-acetylase OafA/YrhL